MDPTVRAILDDQRHLEALRSPSEREWNDLAQRILPSQGIQPYRGSTVNPEQYDGTPRAALNRFAAALEGLLTPAGQRWHHLRPPNGTSGGSGRLERYLEEVRNRLFEMRYGQGSSFAAQNVEVYRQVGLMGNGCLLVTDELGRRISYKSIPMREIYMAEDASGRIDRIHRVWTWRGYQAEQFFKQNELPAQIRARISRDRNCTLRFLHCVKPNSERQPGRLNYRGMKYASYYVGLEDQVLIREGGFRTMPYAIARYVTQAGDVWGTGPGQDALAAMRMANTIKRSMIVAANRHAEPPLGVHGENVRVSLRPNAIVRGAISEAGRPLVQPIGLGERYELPMDLLQGETKIVQDAFLDSLWQILVEKPTATATEVLQRSQEKGILLSPTAGRMQNDYLGDIIIRELDIGSQAGMFDDAEQEAPELADMGGVTAIEFDNPLTRAARSGDGVAILQFVEGLSTVAAIDRTALRVLNGTRAARALAKAYGAPSGVLNSEDEIKAMEEEEQQMQQNQQLIQAAPAASAAAANLARLGVAA